MIFLKSSSLCQIKLFLVLRFNGLLKERYIHETILTTNNQSHHRCCHVIVFDKGQTNLQPHLVLCKCPINLFLLCVFANNIYVQHKSFSAFSLPRRRSWAFVMQSSSPQRLRDECLRMSAWEATLPSTRGGGGLLVFMCNSSSHMHDMF